MINIQEGKYCFDSYPMFWTELALGLDQRVAGNGNIAISVYLTDAEIQSLVEMMHWAWDNEWFEKSASEVVCSQLLKKHNPEIYDKVYAQVHQEFCNKYPNSEQIDGFGVYEIFIPDEIVDYAREIYNS